MRLPFRLSLWTTPLALLAATLACNLPGEAIQADPFATDSAHTVEAFLTQVAAGTLYPPGTPPVATATPTQPSPPTETPAPPTSSTGCVDRASFVADVTVPDDANFAPGTSFTKTWRLKNTGTCTWTPAYSLVFAEGNLMGGPPSQPLPGLVAPNEDVDLSVALKAPTTDGIHRGNWKLRNPSDVVFGIGKDAPFFVQIIVGPTFTPSASGETVFDMAARFCEAEWRSSAGVLPCPGTVDDPNGYVLRLDAPKFEGGRTEDEPALLTRPQSVMDGAISGRYPPVAIQTGYRFQAYMGCRFDAEDCNVIYQLNYRADGGPLQILNQWVQTYDGEWHRVDLDLSSLAGKSVELVLAVTSNGQPSDDQALWFTPRITR